MQVDIMLFLLVSSSTTTTTSGSCWGEILSLESTKVYDKLLLLQSAGIVCVCVRARVLHATQSEATKTVCFDGTKNNKKKKQENENIFLKNFAARGNSLSLSLLILYFVFIFSYLLFARQCRRIRRRRRRQTQFITGDSVIIYKVS